MWVGARLVGDDKCVSGGGTGDILELSCIVGTLGSGTLFMVLSNIYICKMSINWYSWNNKIGVITEAVRLEDQKNQKDKKQDLLTPMIGLL